MKRIKTFVLAIVTALSICLAGCKAEYIVEKIQLGLETFKNDKTSGVQNTDELTGYCYSSSGDMRGGHYSVQLSAYDENRVVLSYSSADWYYSDPEIEEYFVDASILSDIREIYEKYNMKSWEAVKFTDEDVCDGASYSYSFYFGINSISFSSQIFPEKYSAKLDEIDEVIAKYTKNAEPVPGFVNPNSDMENAWVEGYLYPYPDKITIRVSSYVNHKLTYVILNGTEKEISVSDDYRITDLDTKEVIAFCENSRYKTEVWDNGTTKNVIELDDFLRPGHYMLEIADTLSCEFEIK